MEISAQRIPRGFGALAAWVFGPETAPPVLLLPSLAADHRMWLPQIGALAQSRRVIALDTRGHGGSDAPEGGWGLADLAADAVAVLDGLGVARADVVGLSLGGSTALQLALDHPGRVGRVVCACARADAPTDFVAAWTARLAAARGQGLAALWPATAERWFAPAWRAANPESVAAFGTMFAQTSLAGYAGCIGALGRMDLRRRLPAMTRPVAYVAAGADAGIPAPVMQAMADATPGARLALIEGAGHLANVDSAAAFNRLLSELLPD